MSAFVLAVGAATVTLLVVSEASRYRVPLGIFALIAPVAFLFGLVPALIAFRKDFGLVSCSALGCLTGLFAISVAIVFSTNLNFTSAVTWDHALKTAFYLPAFGFAGLIGGAVFGFVRNALATG